MLPELFTEFLRPTYTVSTRGKSMLTHNGFKYFWKSDTQHGLKTRWNCSYTRNHRYVCRAKAWTYMNEHGIENVSFDGHHCHNAYSYS